MAKNKYIKPILMEIDPEEPVTIHFGGSQGTSGDDSQFTWDYRIDPYDYEMFWLSYDETDLESIDTDHDLYISYEEFIAWYEDEQPW